MVVVDAAGHPMKYDTVQVLEDVVATQNSRIEIEVPGPDGRGWQRADSLVDTQEDEALDESWREDIAAGSRHLLEETWVPANDPHYDARVFPCVHPYATGSLLAEVGSGGTQRFSRNRLMRADATLPPAATAIASQRQWSFIAWPVLRLLRGRVHARPAHREMI